MSSSCEAPAGRPRVLRGDATRRARAVGGDDLADIGAAVPMTLRERVAVAVEEGRRAGYERGYREGRDAAAADAERERLTLRADVSSVLDTLARAASDLDRRSTAALGDVEEAIVRGAFELATAILGRPAADGGAGDAIRRALALAPHDQVLTIRLHPRDAAALGELDALVGGHTARVVADPAVARDACVVEGGTWSVDTSLAAALDRAREALWP